MKIFKFEHPEYLIAASVVLLLYTLWFIAKARDKNTLLRLGEEAQVKRLVKALSPQKRAWKFFLVNLAVVMIALALANPQLGSKMEKATRKGADIMIALDISRSMLAQDIKPNRLTRAKMAISRLVDKLEGDRIGIIVFAAEAYTQLPITTDYGAAKMFLSSVNTDYINNQGTSIAAAIEKAMQTFEQKPVKDNKKNKALIIITDGEDHEQGAVDAAKKAAAAGIKIYTIGMGLESGAPIPVYRNGVKTGYKKDREGHTVITKLNENLLREIAADGGGYFVRANNSNTGLKKIFKSISKLDKEEIETRSFKEYEGWFQIFVFAAILFLLIEILITEKRGKFADRFNIFTTNSINGKKEIKS